MKTLIAQRLQEALEKARSQLEQRGEVDRSVVDKVEVWNSLLQAKVDAERAKNAKQIK